MDRGQMVFEEELNNTLQGQRPKPSTLSLVQSVDHQVLLVLGSPSLMLATPVEDTTYTLLKPRLSREKLLEYRQQWTVDNEASRNIRYQTESRIAGNAAAGKFLTHTLRILPGAPKSMETYRERLVERYGTFAMSALRLHIGTQSLSFKEFRARMQAVGVEINPYELSQILAYISPSNTELSDKEVENFLLVMKGHAEGFSAQAVGNVFFSLCGDAAEDTILSLNTLIASIDTNQHPEMAEGMREFLPAYIGDSDEVSVHAFIELHDDMYASAPNVFYEQLKSVWKI
eukprot:gene22900-25937_t